MVQLALLRLLLLLGRLQLLLAERYLNMSFKISMAWMESRAANVVTSFAILNEQCPASAYLIASLAAAESAASGEALPLMSLTKHAQAALQVWHEAPSLGVTSRQNVQY